MAQKGFIEISSNIDVFKGAFKTLGGSAQQYDDIVFAAGLEALSEAIRLVPVDEGTLSRSINLKPRRDIAPKGIYSLGANVFYSPYVEFGTGTKVDVPDELRDFALQYKGEKQIVGQKAQPYLYPAALNAQEKILRDIIQFVQFTYDSINDKRFD